MTMPYSSVRYGSSICNRVRTLQSRGNYMCALPLKQANTGPLLVDCAKGKLSFFPFPHHSRPYIAYLDCPQVRDWRPSPGGMPCGTSSPDKTISHITVACTIATGQPAAPAFSGQQSRRLCPPAPHLSFVCFWITRLCRGFFTSSAG
jgi:hypothetical protein